MQGAAFLASPGSWSSCWEWCLSKPSTCVHLITSVRRNGSSVRWTGCSSVTDTVCPVADRELVEEMACKEDHDCLRLNQRFASKCSFYDFCPGNSSASVFVCEQEQCVSRRETRNCKEDGECEGLEGQFLCRDGLCHNMTRVMDCTYTMTGSQHDCTDKRNCITLEGMHQCRRGRCTMVEWPYSCTRRCPNIRAKGRSLVVVSGDRTVTAHCSSTTLDTGEVVWRRERRHSQATSLMVVCTHLTISKDTIAATDCVNASLEVNHRKGSKAWDWGEVRRAVVEEEGEWRREVNGIHRTPQLTIFPRTRVGSVA